MANNIFLKDITKGKDNNLNFIRFCAAILVIFSHSFPLTYGSDNKEVLYIISNGQETFGSVAVKIFLIISGFLITQSWDRKKDLKTFFKARILRIFPALMVVILLTTFILGPIFTTEPLAKYFTNTKTYKYILSISLIKMQYNLPGVFENNIYKGAVNGSLWTLYYEFACYCIVAFLGHMNILKKTVVLILFLVCYLLSLNGHLGFMLTSYFVAGMITYIYKDKIKLNRKLNLVFIILLVFSIYLNLTKYIFPFALTYIIICFAFNSKLKLNLFGSKNDLSYGIYIYAFPIQQIISYLLKDNIHWYINLIISLPLTLICAYASWNIIEKPFLNMRNIRIRNLKFNNIINLN